MKAKQGFVLKDIGEQSVVVSIGAASKTFNGMIKLNQTGKFLWNLLQEDVTEEELVASLMEKYEVTKDVASRDVQNFIKTLRKPGIIEWLCKPNTSTQNGE